MSQQFYRRLAKGLLLLSFTFAVTSASAQQSMPKPGPKAKLTYRLIAAPGNTWGYDILSDGKLLIHQPSIPAVAGNKGFKSKAAAQAVAGLVIKKIGRGEMPPSVTVEEMKKQNLL